MANQNELALKCNASSTSYELKLNQLTLELSNTCNKYEEAEKHVTFVESKYKKLEEEKLNYKDQCNASLQSIELMQKNLNATAGINAKLTNDYNELQLKYNELIKELNTHKVLASSQQEANSQISILERTIQDLKLTIHKECTERTEMMIEISDLNDTIKQLNYERNTIGCGGQTSMTNHHTGGSGSVKVEQRSVHSSHSGGLYTGQGMDTDIQASSYIRDKETPEQDGMDIEEEDEQNKLWLQKFKKMKSNNNMKSNSIHRTKSYK